MLVYQLNWDHLEGIDQEIAKGCRRAGIEPGWLVKIVSEINLYLPDDWRMTRSTNNFRVQVVTGDHNIALVGFGFRTRKKRILNIIDSIQLKHFHDSVDVCVRLGKKAGAKMKEDCAAAVPNVYFFDPSPPESVTPLYARQYERRMKKKDGKWADNEYHRIHPITKAGLDLTHFRWIHWKKTGDVEFVEKVNPHYHGRDYWDIKLLEKEDKRASLSGYTSNYNQILTRFGVKKPRLPEETPTPYETEYKFLIAGYGEDAKLLFELLEDPNTFKETHFSIRNVSKKTKKQIDTYFDDDRLSLHAVAASFRVRRKENDNILIALKKRLPAEKGYSDKGLYERIEEEAMITEDQLKGLKAGKPINLFPYRLLSYIIPNYGKLKPWIKVINRRKTIILEAANDGQAELCLDEVNFEIEGKNFGPYYEIEIESKGCPRQKLEEMAGWLEESLGLIPSRQSKYERGISLLKTSQIQPGKKMVIIDTDCGVDDALALILALKSPELDVKAITTVSGNVHVDIVIPNVFKVFQELKLENPPPVARGADRPLKKPYEGAPSVHGNDGLGDIVSVPNPVNMKLDERPAWKLICDIARKNPKQITLITIGPMTNLALAIRNEPEAVYALKNVVAMGGVFFDVGNVAPDAEFNVDADPDAAFEVVRFCRDSCLKAPVDENGQPVRIPEKPSKEDFKNVKYFQKHDPDDPKMVPLTFVGLDVTHKVVLRRAMFDRMVKAHPRNSQLKFIQEITRKYIDFYYRNEGLRGCYLHDPLAVAYVINPAFLEVRDHIIRVETAGNFLSGMIFPDDRPTTNWAWRNPGEEVIGVALKVEKEAFEDFFLKRIVSNQ